MRGLAKGEESKNTDPVLQLFAREGGFLKDIFAGEYRIESIHDPGLSPTDKVSTTDIDTDLIADGDHTAGAFIVGHDGILWAVENTGGVPVLWKRTGSDWVQEPTLPLAANVPPDAITIIPSSGTLALASATNVIRSDNAGVTWTDQAYPTGGAIKSLLFIA